MTTSSKTNNTPEKMQKEWKKLIVSVSLGEDVLPKDAGASLIPIGLPKTTLVSFKYDKLWQFIESVYIQAKEAGRKEIIQEMRENYQPFDTRERELFRSYLHQLQSKNIEEK